jgi:2OG-Fe(II) oxygenase superfamily
MSALAQAYPRAPVHVVSEPDWFCRFAALLNSGLPSTKHLLVGEAAIRTRGRVLTELQTMLKESVSQSISDILHEFVDASNEAIAEVQRESYRVALERLTPKPLNLQEQFLHEEEGDTASHDFPEPLGLLVDQWLAAGASHQLSVFLQSRCKAHADEKAAAATSSRHQLDCERENLSRACNNALEAVSQSAAFSTLDSVSVSPIVYYGSDIAVKELFRVLGEFVPRNSLQIVVVDLDELVGYHCRCRTCFPAVCVDEATYRQDVAREIVNLVSASNRHGVAAAGSLFPTDAFREGRRLLCFHTTASGAGTCDEVRSLPESTSVWEFACAQQHDAPPEASPEAPSLPDNAYVLKVPLKWYKTETCSHAATRARLHADPVVAMVVDNFLSDAECDQVSRLAEARFRPATVNSGGGGRDLASAVRTSLQCDVAAPQLAESYFDRLVAMGALPKAFLGHEIQMLNPNFHFLRYLDGGFLLPHEDGHYATLDYSTDQGPGYTCVSLITVQIYLSSLTDENGGTTRFLNPDDPVRQFSDVRPLRGRALVFEHRLMHAGSEFRATERCPTKDTIRIEVLYRPGDGPLPRIMLNGILGLSDA